MDATMVENDDLLGEEFDPTAEQIEAISQLSPMGALTKPQAKKVQKADIPKKAAGLRKTTPSILETKGVQVSKKMQALRIKPSPKKKARSGKPSNPISSLSQLPPNEVLPSALSKNSSVLSGSVVSQKPLSKRI